MNFQIRTADLSHAELLCEMGRKTFYDAFFEVNTPEDMELFLSETFTEEKMTAELENPDETYFIAFEGEKPAGFAKIRIKNPYLPDENALELQRLYVLQDFQGKKVGHQLMSYCLHFAENQGFDSVWLGVWEQNPNARRFYEKFGFSVFSSHNFMVGTDNQTDLLMKKRLKN